MINLLNLNRKDRRKITGEDFTPFKLVNEILDQFEPTVWDDPSLSWLDPAAGDGNFLVEIKTRLRQAGHSSEHILSNMIFGCELMLDNCLVMIERLYGVKPDQIRAVSLLLPHEEYGRYQYKNKGVDITLFEVNGILVSNIVCADGLKYNYDFGRLSEEDARYLNIDEQMKREGFNFPSKIAK
jgi:hypothetical protein